MMAVPSSIIGNHRMIPAEANRIDHVAGNLQHVSVTNVNE